MIQHRHHHLFEELRQGYADEFMIRLCLCLVNIPRQWYHTQLGRRFKVGEGFWTTDGIGHRKPWPPSH